MTLPKALSGNVTPEHAFHFYRHGSIVNVYELVETIQNVSETSFHHHVTKSRNDFAQWINDMYRKHDLVDKLRSTTSKAKTLSILREALDAEEYSMRDKSQRAQRRFTLPKSPEEKIETATKHINHLHRHLKDHLHYKNRSSRNDITHRDDLMHFDIKKGIIEFGFGLILGIIIGLIFARMIGVY